MCFNLIQLWKIKVKRVVGNYLVINIILCDLKRRDSMSKIKKRKRKGKNNERKIEKFHILQEIRKEEKMAKNLIVNCKFQQSSSLRKIFRYV